jgi:hypothetical protein
MHEVLHLDKEGLAAYMAMLVEGADAVMGQRNVAQCTAPLWTQQQYLAVRSRASAGQCCAALRLPPCRFITGRLTRLSSPVRVQREGQLIVLHMNGHLSVANTPTQSVLYSLRNGLSAPPAQGQLQEWGPRHPHVLTRLASMCQGRAPSRDHHFFPINGENNCGRMFSGLPRSCPDGLLEPGIPLVLRGGYGFWYRSLRVRVV